MASAVEEAIGLAATASVSLAGVLGGLAATLVLPDPPGSKVRSDADLIGGVLAPAILTAADVAAIGALIAADAILVGRAAVPNGQDPATVPQIPSPTAPSSRDAATAFYAAAAAATTALPMIVSPGRGYAGGLARALCASAEASFLGQAFVAEANSNFADRQSALDAAARIGAAMDDASDRIARCAGRGVFDLLDTAARQAAQYVATLAADLRPVVLVRAGRSFPSVALAYALYGDPSRAPDLVARNRCGTGLFMPPVFEALAPDRS